MGTYLWKGSLFDFINEDDLIFILAWLNELLHLLQFFVFKYIVRVNILCVGMLEGDVDNQRTIRAHPTS